MQIVKKLEKVLGKVFNAIANLASIIMVVMMLLIVMVVVTRTFGMQGLLGTEEYVAMFQVVMVGLGLCYAHHFKGLVHVGFFMKKLPGRIPMIVWTIEQWIASAILVVWLLQSIQRIPAVKNLTQVASLPAKPFLALMTVGVAFYLISQVFEAVKCTVGLFNKELEKEIQDEWPA